MRDLVLGISLIFAILGGITCFLSAGVLDLSETQTSALILGGILLLFPVSMFLMSQLDD